MEDNESQKKVKDNKNREEPERLFQIFLVVLGVALGTGGTCIWESRSNNRQKESILRIVKASVQLETSIAKSLKEYLVSKKDVERLVPQGFDPVHDPGLYLSLRDSFGQLNDEIVLDLQSFHLALKSCITFKKMFQEGLLWCQENKGQPLPKGCRENYITALTILEQKGQKVISTLERLYPHIKMYTDAGRDEPRIEELDFEGSKELNMRDP